MRDLSCIDALLAAMTLYEDEDLLVVDKPAGLAVQKGTGTDEHLDGMLSCLAEWRGYRGRLVHRLDKDTAGCLLVAKSREAAAWLGRELMARRVTKTYWAVVHGVPEPRHGLIDRPLLKLAGARGGRVEAVEHGHPEAQHALTAYEVLAARADRLAWVALTPFTGRQHQLRAHMAAIGHPMLGDGRYSASGLPTTRLSLHLLARGLAFRHPKGHLTSVLAPLPPHMRATFRRLGFRSEGPA